MAGMKANRGQGGRPAPARRVCEATGKVRYPDGRAAVDALHQAATARHFAEQDGTSTRRRECRHYRCPDCRGWHLTSMPFLPESAVAAGPLRERSIDDAVRRVGTVVAEMSQLLDGLSGQARRTAARRVRTGANGQRYVMAVVPDA